MSCRTGHSPTAAIVLLITATGCGQGILPNEPLNTLGTNGEVGHMLLRNVYVQRPLDGEYQPDEDAVVRLTLYNQSNQPDTLQTVTSPYARGMTQHWDKECDGTAEQVASILILPKGIVPAPGQPEVGHAPYYLQITDFTRPVLAGTTVPITFTFTRAGTVTLNAMVQPREDIDVPAPLACLGTTRLHSPGTSPSGQ